MKNRIGLEIPVEDVEKAINFYETVFGWKFDRETIPNQGVYQMNEFVQIGIFKTEKVRPKGVNLGFGVEDVKKTLEKIKAAGGQVVKEAFIYAGGDTVGVFKDVSGNELSLWSEKT